MNATCKNRREPDFSEMFHSLFGHPFTDSYKEEKSMTRQDHHTEIVNILVDLNDAIKIYDVCWSSKISSDERDHLDGLQECVIRKARILKDLYKII